MEKLVRIAVRTFACFLFVQPVVVAILLISIVEEQNPALLYAIIAASCLLCISAGIAIWKYAPSLFFRIFLKQKELIESNT